jgi:pimeloyl-ACP methyl ester carboxylesterase
MALHNARILAQARMLRRLVLIGLMSWARLAILTGRLAAQEADPGRPDPLPLPTLGGKQLWADELFFHQWRIQRNVLDGHYRLLDEDNLRHASGTYRECRAALERIKRERHLPPMTGKAVVVLHGLVRSRSSMKGLCRYLRQQGGYEVFNVGYPSTRDGIAEHARCLRHVLRNLDGIEEINFVAHSMGNIVVRHYLGDLARQEPWKQSAGAAAADRRAAARFHRFVMLGPPNQGALLASMFADNVVFKQIMGESGQQLGRDWPDLEKRLATPTFDFGVIAGGKGDQKGYSPLLPGDNDGTVTVESTKLAGARDFAVFPVLHSFIMDDDQVRQCVLRFLQQGYFTSEQGRQPLEKQPVEKQP